MSAGVPASQLHRYGGLGCIHITAILQPLDFILPEKLVPESEMDLNLNLELDLTADLNLSEPDPPGLVPETHLD